MFAKEIVMQWQILSIYLKIYLSLGSFLWTLPFKSSILNKGVKSNLLIEGRHSFKTIFKNFTFHNFRQNITISCSIESNYFTFPPPVDSLDFKVSSKKNSVQYTVNVFAVWIVIFSEHAWKLVLAIIVIYFRKPVENTKLYHVGILVL